MTTQTMKFTWKGYLLAPLLAPLGFAALLVGSGGALFPGGGLVTAALYWMLVDQAQRRTRGEVNG